MDVVLLNAGWISAKYMEGKEGFEETIQTNVLSTALLALLLLPWLKKVGGGKAHMGFVTSGVHRSVQIKEPKWPQQQIPQYFSQEKNWPSGNPDMYAVSKLLEQYIVREIEKLALGKDGRYVGFSFEDRNVLIPGSVARKSSSIQFAQVRRNTYLTKGCRSPCWFLGLGSRHYRVQVAGTRSTIVRTSSENRKNILFLLRICLAQS